MGGAEYFDRAAAGRTAEAGMNKLPAFLFYPRDWLSDPGLRSVSASARGLWIDLLCLLFESEMGHKLDVKTRVDEATLISRMTGVPKKQVAPLLRELETAGVLTRYADGIIYSRRMKREEEIRAVRREAGKLGGNPILVKQRVNQPHNDQVKQDDNQNPTPSISISFSSSKDKKYQSKGDALNFDEDQIQNLRREIANATGHSLLSEANRVCFEELCERVLENVQKKTVKNVFAYAIQAARNLKAEGAAVP